MRRAVSLCSPSLLWLPQRSAERTKSNKGGREQNSELRLYLQAQAGPAAPGERFLLRGQQPEVARGRDAMSHPHMASSRGRGPTLWKDCTKGTAGRCLINTGMKSVFPVRKGSRFLFRTAALFLNLAQHLYADT